MQVITQNVKCFPEMAQHKVEFDVELTSTEADIVLWQEIQIQRYIDAIENLDHVKWGHYIGMDKGGAPISWRLDKYEFVDGGEKTMYLGVAKISNTRKVVWVKLRHKRTGEIIVVINAHFVAGAFTPAKTSPLRRLLWRRCRKVLLKVVVRFVSAGFACVVGGDFNRHHFMVIGAFIEIERGPHTIRRTVQAPVPSDEIDQLYFINGDDLEFGPLRYDECDGRNSDHQGNRVSTGVKKRVKK